jgi:hypothetical protein
VPPRVGGLSNTLRPFVPWVQAKNRKLIYAAPRKCGEHAGGSIIDTLQHMLLLKRPVHWRTISNGCSSVQIGTCAAETCRPLHHIAHC